MTKWFFLPPNLLKQRNENYFMWLRYHMSTRKYIGKLVNVQWLWRRCNLPFWLRNYIGKYELIECPGAINRQFGAGLSQEPHPATQSTKFVPWNIVRILKMDKCKDLCSFVSFRCYYNLTLYQSEWVNHFGHRGSSQNQIPAVCLMLSK